MYKMLCPFVDKNRVSRSVLCKQLELEYGHRIEETPDSAGTSGHSSDQPTEEELEQAMDDLGI